MQRIGLSESALDVQVVAGQSNFSSCDKGQVLFPVFVSKRKIVDHYNTSSNMLDRIQIIQSMDENESVSESVCQ